MRGTPEFGILQGTCADQGLSEVTYGYQRWTDVQQTSRGCPLKVSQVAQRIEVTYSAALTSVFRAFPQF
jgi:hypothetical protein